MTKHVPPPTGEHTEAFTSLCAAIHPAWQAAVLRLAKGIESVDERLRAWGGSNHADGSFVRESRDLIETLIDFLDSIDAEPDLEPWLGWPNNGASATSHDDREMEDEHNEPELGSFDRMTDQTKSWDMADLRDETYGGWPVLDGEIDDDREEDDAPEESEPSGCGDQEGVIEQQAGSDLRSWQIEEYV